MSSIARDARLKVAEYEKRATTARDPETRQYYIQLARDWREMARQCEKLEADLRDLAPSPDVGRAVISKQAMIGNGDLHNRVFDRGRLAVASRPRQVDEVCREVPVQSCALIALGAKPEACRRSRCQRRELQTFPIEACASLLFGRGRAPLPLSRAVSASRCIQSLENAFRFLEQLVASVPGPGVSARRLL